MGVLDEVVLRGQKQDGAAGAEAPVSNRLGDKLITLGIITQDQLDVALHEKRRSSKMLGSILVDLGFVDHSTLSAILAERTGNETFDPSQAVIAPEVARQIPKEVAQRHKVLLLGHDDGIARVAMSDPYDVLALDTLRRYLPAETEVVAMVATESVLQEVTDRAYGVELSIDGILREIQTGEVDSQSLLNDQGRYSHPVVRLVNALLLDAARLGASDLHFEPEGTFVRLRYRVDGAMLPVRAFHVEYWPSISQRIKLMSGMNIAETRQPQDGRFSLYIAGREIDFRASVMPTVHGENVVLRILDHNKSQRKLAELGFSEHILEHLDQLLARPEGIFVVTGPTGSGKTTSLYAMLNSIKSVETNIMTLEDPVEYKFSLIRQTQVRESLGLSFADGIRAILRQDPDIIFIGEVRDDQTAQMALRAAMTGHQVFSTVHTNDAFGVIPRFLDLGLAPSMMAGNLIGSMSQRLVRMLCPTCKEEHRATPEECRKLRVDEENPPVIFRPHPHGCANCLHTGYRGRTAIAELLGFSREVDDLLVSGASRAAIIAQAKQQGYVSLARDAINKILAGHTSLAAASRAVHLGHRG